MADDRRVKGLLQVLPRLYMLNLSPRGMADVACPVDKRLCVPRVDQQAMPAFKLSIVYLVV